MRAAAEHLAENGLDAQQGNAAAASTTAGSSCTDGQTVCAGTDVGQCVGGSIETTACSGGTQCFVLPLVNKAGTVYPNLRKSCSKVTDEFCSLSLAPPRLMRRHVSLRPVRLAASQAPKRVESNFTKFPL